MLSVLVTSNQTWHRCLSPVYHPVSTVLRVSLLWLIAAYSLGRALSLLPRKEKRTVYNLAIHPIKYHCERSVSLSLHAILLSDNVLGCRMSCFLEILTSYSHSHYRDFILVPDPSSASWRSCSWPSWLLRVKCSLLPLSFRYSSQRWLSVHCKPFYPSSTSAH